MAIRISQNNNRPGDPFHTRQFTNGRNGGDNFAKLEFVQDGGLAGSIETDHQDTHLLFAKEIKEFREAEAHLLESRTKKSPDNSQKRAWMVISPLPARDPKNYEDLGSTTSSF